MLRSAATKGLFFLRLSFELANREANREINLRISPMLTAGSVKIAPGKLLIGGEWRNSAHHKTFDTINPSTAEVITQVAQADEEDVEAAVRAARAAFDDSSGHWRKMSASERGRLLWKIADLLEKHIEEFAELETLDNGKPIFESRQVDMPMIVDVLRYYAGWATKIHGETVNTFENALTYTVREPVGVVGAIVAWNFPLLLASWKLGPALACGNTVVLKPAEQTPLTALRLGEICLEAGLPPGVLNIITGGPEAGAALVRHPGVDKLAFTGSTAVGKSVMRNAADGLKRVTLELGGKSPNIVFADSELDAAVRGAINGIFYGKGEVCCAGSRLFVERKVREEFTEKLLTRARKLQPGDPLDPKTRLGALVSREQMETVLRYIALGKQQGADLLTGGSRVQVGNGNGYFVEPTIFGNVNPEMAIAREEIFGPVLAMLEFDDLDQVAEMANQTSYGLAAAVWTRDLKRAHALTRRLKAGTVWVNTYGLMDAALPFGGYKQSGFGRELGSHAIEHYTELKTVWLQM